jgi:uncharacterized protein (DUF58 family)
MGPAAGVFLPLTACALLLAWALGGVALVFAALMVSALACSWLLGRRNLRGIALRSRRSELRTVGEEFLLELELLRAERSSPARDLVFAVGGTSSRPAGLLSLSEPGRATRTPLALKLTQRGPVAELELTVESSYPFGLLTHAARYSLPVDLVGLPRLGSLGDLARLEARGSELTRARHTRPSEEDEFRSVVEWRPGQSLRRAHWKLTARRGRPLLVEREERSAVPVMIVLATELAPKSRRRPESFELAVSLCATLCEHYLRRGVSVRLDTGEEEPAPRVWGREGLTSCLVRLAHAQQHETAPLHPTAARPSPLRRRDEALILVHAGNLSAASRVEPGDASLVLDVDAPGLDALFISGRSFGSSPALSWSDAG